MHSSLLVSLIASWVILCFSNPLQTDNQRYWIPYKVYQPTAYQLRPTKSTGSSLHATQQPKPLTHRIYHNSRSNNYENPSSPPKYARPEEKSHMDIIPRDFYLPRQSIRSKYSGDLLRGEEQRRLQDERRKEQKEVESVNDLEEILSTDYSDDDIELRNTIENEILTDGSISEETRRVVRQVSKKRPGFFWTLARLAFETYNDTRSAIQQINEIVNNNVAIDTTTIRPPTSNLLTNSGASSTASSVDQTNLSSNLAEMNATMATTTEEEEEEEPYQLTRNGVLNIISRNLKGLRRLFNIEWREALDQSEISVREFQKDLGNQIGYYLRDNPNAY